MNIKRNYNYTIDKEPGTTEGKLRFRIKWNRNKNIVAFNVGYRVDSGKWSSETSRCKNNTTHGAKKVAASIINKKIQAYEDFAEQIFSEYEAKGVEPTADDFRTAFSILIGKTPKAAAPVSKEEESVLAVFDKFVADMGRVNDWTRATYQKFNALRRKIDAFAPVNFDSFNHDGLNSFILYLRESHEMRNSTIGKQIGFLKWFLKWAYAKEYSKQAAYQTFTPRLKRAEKKIIFLTWDELMTVYDFPFAEEHSSLARVRDVFCFCCFTSLRYSDVANLRRSDVYENHIEVTTVKTADSLRIELNDFSRAILHKYEDQVFDDDLALPIITNQRMNDYLKVVGEMCGIDTPVRETYYIGTKRYDQVSPKWRVLSTHAGRRTFICNALMLGIAPTIVMKWTGHSDYKAMKPYIDVTDKAKGDAMQLFNKK